MSKVGRVSKLPQNEKLLRDAIGQLDNKKHL
jgi:hypothetical protein